MPSSRRSTSRRMASLSPGNSNPATSTRSVGGMNACATSRWGRSESDRPSGGGKLNPAWLSNGSRDNAANREFHIRAG